MITCSTSIRPSSSRPASQRLRCGLFTIRGESGAGGRELEAGGGTLVDRGVGREAGVEAEIGEDLHEQRGPGAAGAGDDHLAASGPAAVPSWSRSSILATLSSRVGRGGAGEAVNASRRGSRRRFRAAAREGRRGRRRDRAAARRCAGRAAPGSRAMSRARRAGGAAASDALLAASRARPCPTGTRSSGRVRRCTGDRARSARNSAAREPAPRWKTQSP